MCCLRRVSAKPPSSFQIQPPFPRPFPPFIPILPFARARGAYHPILRIYPASFLLRFAFKFHLTFSTPISPPPRAAAAAAAATVDDDDGDDTATYAVYIPRARLLPPSRQPHFLPFSRSLLALGMRATYQSARREARESRGANFGAARDTLAPQSDN